MEVADAVIISYGILGIAAYSWFTRRWSFLFRMALVVAFGFIWLVLAFHTTHDHTYDPDLGIRLSSLTFKDAAIWNLPLALAIWAPALCFTVLARRVVQRWL